MPVQRDMPIALLLCSPMTSHVCRFFPLANMCTPLLQPPSLSSAGTSMASPHVCGVMAKILSFSPDATPADVSNYLVKT